LVAWCGVTFGVSQSLNQPVGELLRERLPATLRNLVVALVLAWILGLSLATAVRLSGSQAFTLTADGVSGAFISTPRPC